MMNADYTIDTEAYPELDSENATEETTPDDHPVVANPNDWNVGTLHNKYLRGIIDLQPTYQRGYVWALRPELPSRLIESLLLDIPVPPIYMAKMAEGKLEVIDGQQRLTTLVNFLEGHFPLQKLVRMSSLNGLRFAELKEEHQNKIMDCTIRTVVVDTGSNTNLRYEVFERLNRGSVALNEQELRNCVYRGPFNDLLTRLEASSEWRNVRGTREPEPRFVEREMILRFFAFANRLDHYRGNLKAFLNDFMASHAPRVPTAISEQSSLFQNTMRNVYSVFGKQCGRLYSTGTEDNPTVDGNWDSKFSISALDIQASSLIAQAAAKVDASADQIREAYAFYLLANPHVRLAISRQPAGKDATFTRWYGFRAIVQEILSNTQLEPRFFSYEFRVSLWNTSTVCKLCHNPIHTFEDCTVDHKKPYSKGGKTIPSNGQLAHRFCNARKCANADLTH